MLLSYEDAYFYKLLGELGFEKEVEMWIEGILNSNETLEGINLELVYHQSNLYEIISLLHNYIGDNKVNDKQLCDKLRLFIKDKIDKDEITVLDAVEALYGFAYVSENTHEKYWNDFYVIAENYNFESDKTVKQSKFYKNFYHFLETGEMIEEFNVSYGYPVYPSIKESRMIAKKEMNKIRYGLNYIVIPNFLIITCLLTIITIVLLNINEEKYSPYATILFSIIGIIIIAFFLYSKITRKKEVDIEVSKFDFTIKDDNKEEYTIHTIEDIPFILNKDGITLNSEVYSYDNLIVTIHTSNTYLKVNIFVEFLLKHSNRYLKPYFYFKLDNDLLNAINKFNIKISNQKELDYIVNNQKQAFKKIIKYGYLKKN